MARKTEVAFVSILLFASISAVLISSPSASAAPDADPAENITYENVKVSENVVDPGEPFTVSALAMNTGAEGKLVKFFLYVDEKAVDSGITYVRPGENKKIRMVRNKLWREGDHSVRVGSASPVTVTVRHVPAEFEYGDMKVTRENEKITASLSARNVGSVEGDTRFDFYVDGKAKSMKAPPSVGPGSKVTVSFKHEFESSGTYWVRINKIGPKEVKIPGVLSVAGGIPNLAGIGHGAKLEKNAALEAGKFGNALSLNGGKSSYAVVKGPEDLNYNKDFTWAAWIKTDSSSVQTIMARTNNKSDAKGPRNLFKSGPNSVGAGEHGKFCIDTGFVGYTQAHTIIDDGKWHHVGLTMDFAEEGDDLARLYVDENMESELKANWDKFTRKNYNIDDWPMQIGWDARIPGDLSGPFKGLIDNVMLYNRALSENEMKNLYEGGVPQKKLIGQYKFEGVSGKGSHVTEWRYFGENVRWDSLHAKTSIPERSAMTTTVQVSNDGENVLDKMIVPIEDGSKSYDLGGLENAKYASIETQLENAALLDQYTLVGWKTKTEKVKESWEFAHEWGKGKGSSVTMHTALPSKIVLENLTLNHEIVLGGEEVKVSVDAKNKGTNKGDELATLLVDGVFENSEMVTLSPGEGKTLEFDVSTENLGTHTVEIGGMTSEFTVAASEPEILGSSTEVTLENENRGVVHRVSPAAVEKPPVSAYAWKGARPVKPGWKILPLSFDKKGFTDPAISELRGDPEKVKGRSGKAVRLDSNDAVVTKEDYDLSEGFTFMAWVKPAENGETGAIMTKNDPLLGEELSGEEGWSEGVELIGVGKGWGMDESGLFMDVFDFSTSSIITPFKEGEWYHVTVTYDGGTRRMYVNGKGGVIPVPNPGFEQEGPDMVVSIGSTTGWRDSFRGLVDGVKLYDRALSKGQIKMTAGLGGVTLKKVYKKEKVKPGDHVKGTLSIGTDRFPVIPMVPTSPYYRCSLEPTETPNEWKFDVCPTEKAAGKDIEVHFGLYAEGLWSAAEPSPTAETFLTISVRE